jgi:DNA-binding transcriptional ArsR family regulator
MLSEATELRKQAGLTVAALETGEVATDRELAALVHGARRVEGDGRSLGRDLAGLTEGLAYTRIDGRAGAALDALDRRLQESGTRTFEPALWRALVADLEAGRLGSPDLVGELLTLTGMTLEVSEATLAQALEALTRARAASAAEQARSEVIAAEAALTRAVEQLDALTTRLGEWDNFQSVLTLTRDILNRQKNLTERTRKFAEENR